MNNELLIIPTTFIAGFIDAIAGGGGLLTLPMWSMVLGPGAVAVATNKVGALLGASMALWVYQRKHPLPWREGLWFLTAVMGGAGTGSQLTSLIPPKAFATILLCLCPLVLWLVWSKERLFGDRPSQPAPVQRFALAGFLVGVYDGFFGPGGGTFMLLALLTLTQMPLMSALASPNSPMRFPPPRASRASRSRDTCAGARASSGAWPWQWERSLARATLLGKPCAR